MTSKRGRPAGRVLHAEAFEALLAARNLLKKDVCVDAGISPGYLADLLAHRGGASDEVVASLSSTLAVRPGALFPELVNWVSPLPDRDGRRRAAA